VVDRCPAAGEAVAGAVAEALVSPDCGVPVQAAARAAARTTVTAGQRLVPTGSLASRTAASPSWDWTLRRRAGKVAPKTDQHQTSDHRGGPAPPGPTPSPRRWPGRPPRPPMACAPGRSPRPDPAAGGERLRPRSKPSTRAANISARVTVQDCAEVGSQGSPWNSWRSTATGFMACLRAVPRQESETVSDGGRLAVGGVEGTSR
jgi:hypothetical protein